MNWESEIRDWLMLSLLKGFGPQKGSIILQSFGNAQKALDNPQEFQKQTGLVPLFCYQETDRILTWAAHNQIQILPRHHPLFPLPLQSSPYCPNLIYCKGTLPSSYALSFAVVGARRPQPQGFDACKSLLQKLPPQSILVSGLAAGIDQCAHHQAVLGPGTTIAVLGQGLGTRLSLDKEHMQNLILKAGGCILSQFHPFLSPSTTTFPARNAIISGLSQFCIVLQASAKSGALITSQCALDEGKEVYAVPGDILNPIHQGTNNLLKQGANILTSNLELWNALGFSSIQSNSISIPPQLQTIWRSLQQTPMPLGQICQETAMSTSQTLALLAKLQSHGLLRQNNLGEYSTFAP